MTTTDQHLNTGSMALDALPQDEAAAFAEHLETCPTCSAELTSFLETAAILGSSVAQTPPAGLRRSVMQAIAVTPQLPPLTAPVPAADPALGRHRQEDPAPAPVEEEAADLQGPPTNPLATVIAMRRPWYRRPQSLLAAAVAALVLGGGITAVIATRSPAAQSASACVAAAPDRTTISPTKGAEAGGTVTLAPSCDAVRVNMPKLPDAPAGKVYQVWVLKGQQAPVSVKVLKNNSGEPDSAFDAEVHAGATAIGVTLEPGPVGSAKPTTDPFWVVPLAS